ncbi:wax ester/triacylglycerol synthase domain-containing protein [Saccharomonospora piscinae]|uniref:wax ester/triacylglycerol synthase domain-containing protein n=1 Tax=Saccharomonospora piscinae TaxID=687388 RepID=UPI0004643B43|nr:WS/DGAT domain-containing protein [Saccharomonospora piscinae]
MRTPTAPRLLVVSCPDAPASPVRVRQAAEHVWPTVDVVGERVDVPATWLPPGAAATRTARTARTARTLGRLLDRVRPDLVLVTRPVLADALGLLHRHRGLALPFALWDPDEPTSTSGDLDTVLRRLARTPPRPGPRRLPASDALFAHVDTPAVPQHVGTVLLFDAGPDLTAEHAAGMLAGIPGALGRITAATATRAARWVPVPGRGAASGVEVVASPELGPQVDAFFSEPLRAGGAAGAMRLVTGLPDGRRALLVKLHHALGDGMTVLQALLSDTDDAGRLSWSSRPAPAVGSTGVPGLRAGAGTALAGLRRLAAGGRAPAAPTDGPVTTARRHHALALLPGRAVRTRANALGASAAEFLLAVFAQAWHETGLAGRAERFRLMVPWSVRGTGDLRAAGNQTGAVPVDLPVGPMPLPGRVARVAAELRSHTGGGVPEAANLVVQALGALPPPAHRAAARLMYRGGWFNAVGTVMPGPRREVRWHGAVMSVAYPVLSLAPGTGLAWGALTWGPWITLGLTATPEWGGHADAVTDRMSALVAEHAGQRS